MSHLSLTTLSGRSLGLAAVLLATPCAAQTDWTATADAYDAQQAAAFVGHLAEHLAERHGPMAETLFAMNAELAATPSFFMTRTPPGMRRTPAPPRILYRIEASHLMHHQGTGSGSLGTLHGTSAHPLGVGWFPHSMFAQSGGVFARWGHARLLAAVAAHKEEQSD